MNNTEYASLCDFCSKLPSKMLRVLIFKNCENCILAFLNNS
jgi:hypothetical protein